MTRKRWKIYASMVLLFLCCGVAGAREGGMPSSSPAERRQELIEDSRAGTQAITRLKTALNDESMIVRRTAIRLLVGLGAPAGDAIRAALENTDPNVRRAALLGLESIGEVSLQDLAVALDDSHEVVRYEAVSILLETSGNGLRKELVNKASLDSSPLVRNAALRGMFTGADRISLREEFMDRYIEIVKTFNLQAGGWKFKLDPEASGHTKDWYAPDFNYGDWDEIGIEKAWQEFGYDYVGVAWYRGSFEMPAESSVESDGVEIRFEGVDESGWVWVNGKYAGQQDIGMRGWNIPFALDVTELVQWGGENHIAVRVMNTRRAGGIWRPISVNFLKVR